MCQRTDVVYGVPVRSAQSPQPRKKRRLAQYLQNIKDSYTISRRTYPWVGWALLGTPVLLVALAVVLDGNAETEDGATGGKIAGPVAAQVIDAAVNQ